MRKYSLVGFALLAATAITAAFVPSNAQTNGDVLDGSLIRSNDTGDWTCTEVGDGECSYTITQGKTNGVSATGADGATATSFSTHVYQGTAFGTTDPDQE